MTSHEARNDRPGSDGHGRVDIVKHVTSPVPGFLFEVLRDAGFEGRVVDRLGGDQLPRRPDHGDAMIVLGGPMGAYDEEAHPFLAEERDYFGELAGRDEPLLCICLGAQILARALGGDARAGHDTEIGWCPLELTESGRRDPLLRHFDGVPGVMQWHGDTFTLPDGTVRLAGSPTFPNQAFRCGRRTYGVQFHPEVEEDTVRGWVDFYRDNPEYRRDPEDAAEMLEETATLLAGYQERCRRFFRAFLELVEARDVGVDASRS